MQRKHTSAHVSTRQHTSVMDEEDTTFQDATNAMCVCVCVCVCVFLCVFVCVCFGATKLPNLKHACAVTGLCDRLVPP
jgi:hypothetical protein